MTNRSCTPDAADAMTNTAAWPPALHGQARIIDMAFRGRDLVPLIEELETRARNNPRDAAAIMDLASILIVLHQREEGFRLQQQALGIEQVFRQTIDTATQSPLKVLMFVGPGDFMANIPVQFLLEGGNISLDLVYVRAGEPLPEQLPEHDLAIVGVAESDESRAILETLSSTVKSWPTPVLIDPQRVAALSRESLWQVLAGAPGVVIPRTIRIDRAEAGRLAGDESAISRELAGVQSPIILRPVGSHAGQGLKKIDSPDQLTAYLEEQSAEAFYVSPFIDYRGSDGQFRKYRIAFVDGHPFACHMAMAGHWMLHYLNAGMDRCADKRAQEARWFETFDSAFAVGHAEAFRALHERLGLEYFVIDCAETRDGQLLVFEADTAMVVHAMDSSDMFPYKPPQMRRVFEAFQAMLHAHACQPVG